RVDHRQLRQEGHRPRDRAGRQLRPAARRRRRQGEQAVLRRPRPERRQELRRQVRRVRGDRPHRIRPQQAQGPGQERRRRPQRQRVAPTGRELAHRAVHRPRRVRVGARLTHGRRGHPARLLCPYARQETKGPNCRSVARLSFSFRRSRDAERNAGPVAALTGTRHGYGAASYGREGRYVEETWHHARLIPTSGISGAEEQERRATSALLAVMSAVKEFSRAMLKPLGVPAGTVECYIEVPFQSGDKTYYPDGLIRVRRGSKAWTALVEVKTGRNELAADQLETYLDIAKEQGFDALVTISNQIQTAPGQHPTKVDRRKLRKVALHHWSWTYVLSMAVLQKEHRGVSDPEQAW